MRSHKLTAREYVLKWQHDGIEPLCACGCGKNTAWNVGMRKYTTFIKGHSAKGRVKSDDEKRRIGEKNRVNMTVWMSRHPDVAKKKGDLMTSYRTPEIETKRIQSTKKAYDTMSPEDKQRFSDHAKELWNDGTLVEARAKAAETFKQRFASGEYNFTERNDKISAAITQRYLDGGFEWSTGQYTSMKTGKTCNYRSSWEHELMVLLDGDSRVDTWSYEPLSITYILEGETRRYIPDFLIVFEGRDYLLEVKPPSLADIPINTAKRDAAVVFCQKNGWKYGEWQQGSNYEELFHI
jgi:hypothetical protein